MTISGDARGVQTEVDHVNGAIVLDGAALAITAPVNWTPAHLVKSIRGKVGTTRG